ncbi:Hypothetical_protein [Hexamita inflata]|uniref:Hypothetical_protein n=1 Tax=Hexamita inflata TaxID=28002 RepID=A0AA86U7I5_9EUKA|nr:Hypothetical protein HINF_LOCUS31814 [Hexamita inflata]
MILLVFCLSDTVTVRVKRTRQNQKICYIQQSPVANLHYNVDALFDPECDVGAIFDTVALVQNINLRISINSSGSMTVTGLSIYTTERLRLKKVDLNFTAVVLLPQFSTMVTYVPNLELEEVRVLIMKSQISKFFGLAKDTESIRVNNVHLNYTVQFTQHSYGIGYAASNSFLTNMTLTISFTKFQSDSSKTASLFSDGGQNLTIQDILVVATLTADVNIGGLVHQFYGSTFNMKFLFANFSIDSKLGSSYLVVHCNNVVIQLYESIIYGFFLNPLSQNKLGIVKNGGTAKMDVAAGKIQWDGAIDWM